MPVPRSGSARRPVGPAAIAAGVEERAIGAPVADLSSGAWHERYGCLREVAEYYDGLRLIVSEGESSGRL